MIVSFGGVDRDYYKMSYGEQRAYDEGQRFAQQLKDRNFVNQARADAETAIRSLPAETRMKLAAAGYRGDISPLPPGQDSGVLKKTEGRTRAGHWVEKYEGDPRCWMNQFAPAVKFSIIGFRGLNETDEVWNARCQRGLARWRADNPDKV